MTRIASALKGGVALGLAGLTIAASGLPDPARLYQARANCHNAYDLLNDDLNKGRKPLAEEEAWARTHETLGNSGKPCVAPPAKLAERANNRAISTADGERAAKTFADKQGDAAALTELGLSYLSGMRPGVTKQQGVDLLRKGAEKGDPSGAFIYGSMLAQGAFGEKDYKRALPLIEQAAKAGHVDAMARMATYAYYGIGQKKDLKSAFEWYRQAAERGHELSVFMAFNMINAGEGTKKDFPLAARLARNMANEGNAYGQMVLASALLQDKKPMQYKDEILYWLQQARSGGDDKVREAVDQVYPKAVQLFSARAPAPSYQRPPRKLCPIKTVCTVNHYSGLQSCTSAKDYWNDCDG
jgi:TPR repeat protein